MSTIADIQALGYAATEMAWAGVGGAPPVYCVSGFGVVTFIDASDTATINAFVSTVPNANRVVYFEELG